MAEKLDGWTPDEQEGFDNYVPDFIEAIRIGYLDDHLRDLVRALYTRRGVMEGKEYVVTPAVKYSPAMRRQKKQIKERQKALPEREVPEHIDLELTAEGYKVPALAWKGGGTFQFDDPSGHTWYYEKSAFVGLESQIPVSSVEEVMVWGLKYRVISVANKTAQVVMLETNLNLRANSPYRRSYGMVEEIKVPIEVLKPLMQYGEVSVP